MLYATGEAIAGQQWEVGHREKLTKLVQTGSLKNPAAINITNGHSQSI